MNNVVYLLDEKESSWDRVLTLIEKECNGFGTAFFDTVEYEGFCDGIVYLKVPDSFRETWLNSHYGSLLKKVFGKIYGSDYVDYKVRVLNSHVEVPKISSLPSVLKNGESKVTKEAKVLSPKHNVQKEFHLYNHYTFENFVEGECNFAAFKACQAVVENPKDKSMNLLLIYGAPGLGKTHLLQSIAVALQNKNSSLRIVYREAYEFLRDFVSLYDAANKKDWDLYKNRLNQFEDFYRNCDVLLMDDIQLLKSGIKAQERLSMIIKYLLSKGCQVVLSSDCHPSEFKKLKEGEKPERSSLSHELTANLLNPLENCVTVGIVEPDFDTRMALISKLSKDIPFVETDRVEICRYLAIQRRANVRLIEGHINWLKAMHLLNNVELNLDNVKRMLTAPKDKIVSILTIQNVMELVAAEFSLDIKILCSKSQNSQVSLPRKIAMYLGRELTKESFKKIGEAFSRDYSTVIASINALEEQMKIDKTLKRRVEDLRYMLES